MLLEETLTQNGQTDVQFASQLRPFKAAFIKPQTQQSGLCPATEPSACCILFLLQRRKLWRLLKLKKQWSITILCQRAVLWTHAGPSSGPGCQDPLELPRLISLACFHYGFIHGPTIRRIRAVTDSDKPAHGVLNISSEGSRGRRKDNCWKKRERKTRSVSR